MSDYGDYGYQDFTTASNEAYQLSWDAYNSGDMDASSYWSTVSNNDWSTGTDLYTAGADPFGTDSPSTADGYYGGTGYDTSSSYDYSASSYDTSSSYDTADITAVL